MAIEKIKELFDYAVAIRRQIHQYPEIGFELEKTVAQVTNELKQLGIEYTTRYGKSSIVAELGQGDKLIALRADMDALPVEEKTSLPFKSKISGQMHACGHDAHTAILLAVAKYLKENENKLNCRIRLIFQPSEEGAVSGAKMMVDNGVMEGVDHIICTHCDNEIDSENIGVCYGDYMAACIPASITFKGRTSHATLPQFGIDANAMAVEAYIEMKKMLKQSAEDTPYIWSVGRIAGGQAHNVISDLCEMDISFRFYDMDFAKQVEKNVRYICNDIAQKYGGSADIIWNMSTGAVHNDKNITEKFDKAARKAGLAVQNMPQRMMSEDFGWYLTKARGMIFRFGTKNEELGCTSPLHSNDFCIDENGMKAAIDAFVSYILDFK
ncbi:MAG: amidohydrolase [Clostridia bacterium]|nr:amidohydrolase [Clostridia bacterium]